MRLFRAVPVLLAVFAGPVAAQAPAYYLSQPALSPDGREIAFVSGEDIWTVPAAGGEARLLVAGEGSDARPMYSPDGRRLAYVSTRTGNGDVYVLDLASGRSERVTWDDGYDSLDAWSRDGEWLYFSSTRDNVGNMSGIYRVRANGGTPMPVSREAYRNHEGAAPSPDGRELALTGNGTGDNQWWRNGHSNLEVGAIWLLADDGRHAYRRVTPDDARALWPMWGAGGDTIWYMSDRGGTENLWRTTRAGEAIQVTRFTDGRVLWPSIAVDGSAIVFARDFGLWRFDVASGQAAPVPVTLRGAASAPRATHDALTGEFSELAVSPDGKKVAFVARGEVFAASTDKGGRADRLTRTPQAEFHVAWAPDSRHVVYVSERDGHARVYRHDLVGGEVQVLSEAGREAMRPQVSPDGKHVAFLLDARELVSVDLATRKPRRIATMAMDLVRPLEADRAFAWSPDSRWLAWQAYGERMFRNTFVAPRDGGEAVQASFLANVGADAITWSPDGKALFFSTGQRTEPSQVARVDLLPRVPKFSEETFRNLFREQTPPAVSNPDAPADTPKAKTAANDEAKDKDDAKAGDRKTAERVRVQAEGIRERLALLPIGLDVGALAVSPDGTSLLLTAESAGRTNLFLYPIDELADEPPVPRQLTATAGPKLAAQFAPDGKSVYVLDGGRISVVTVADGKARPLAVTAEVDGDFDAGKVVVFEQAWRWLRDAFHDPGMHGVDWSALRTAYAPRIAAAQTPGTLRELLNLMIGELDASHTGVRGPGQPAFATGHVGITFEREAYEHDGRLRVATIVPGSPVAVAGGVEPGDELRSVDGVAIAVGSNLDRLLEHRVDRETVLAFARGGKTRDVRVKPVDARTIGALAYRAWVAANRAYVDKASGGRLGYVHMADMSMASLQRLYVDLDADNATREGVVVDVRNNFGGFVNAYALDVLARRPYLNMRFRGQPVASARAILGQRSLERRTVLVTNRVTLSDGEDFSEGYRRLGLGRIVGEPTAGWIIYTSNATLPDGSSVRLPFITITTADGQPMEGAPRPVDVPVERALGEGYRGVDSELDTAVRVLLEGQ